MARLHAAGVQQVASASEYIFQAARWHKGGVCPSSCLSNCHVASLEEDAEFLHGQQLCSSHVLLLGGQQLTAVDRYEEAKKQIDAFDWVVCLDAKFHAS